MFREFINLLRDEEGASAVEYGLIVSLISLGAFVALTAYGVSVASVFDHLRDVIDTATVGRL